MVKNAWAKGRKEKCCMIAVDEVTRQLAKQLAIECRVTMKDLIRIALVSYSINQHGGIC